MKHEAMPAPGSEEAEVKAAVWKSSLRDYGLLMTLLVIMAFFYFLTNGISLARFAPLRERQAAVPPPVLCLIGRVVPIKDIKTFIRAMRRVVNRLPVAEGWIVGPEDEDPAYAEECRNLVESLGLQERVKFLGFRRVEDILPQVGVVVLSSISEALPLVLLEGYAAGVPAVSTDVGSCRQLIEGVGADDCALGCSGRVVRIADPLGLADAALELLESPPAWHAARTAAIARVERYYHDALMFARYRDVYDAALAAPALSLPAAAAPPGGG